MYEVDFHPIEKTGEEGSKSGDAISLRFDDAEGIQRIVVIDGGFKHSGERLIEHIDYYYDAQHVDITSSQRILTRITSTAWRPC